MTRALFRAPLGDLAQRLSATCLGALGTCLLAGAPAGAIDRIAWIEDMGLASGVPLVVLPPAAGPVIGIDEQRKTDSFVQTITLAGDAGTVGENNVIVTITRNNGLAPRLGEDTITAEVAKRLPDMSLGLGPPNTRNGFGLFGVVTGSRNGLTCLYAWQAINLADRWINGDEGTPLDERHGMTIRYRICRTTATAAELVGDVQASQSQLAGGRTVWSGGPGFDALSSAAGVVPGSNLATTVVPTFADSRQDVPLYPARPPRERPIRRAPPRERRESVTEPAEPPVTAQGPSVPLP